MMYQDRKADYALAGRDDEDFPETLDAWTLNDFDDVLNGIERSIARLRWSDEPYPSSR